jgi:hypothetical protein
LEQHRGHLTATVHGVDVVPEPVMPAKIAVRAERAQALTRAGQPVPEPITVDEALLDTGAHQCHLKAEIARELGLPQVAGAVEPEHGVGLGGVTRKPLVKYEATVEILGVSHDVVVVAGQIEHPQSPRVIIGRELLLHYQLEWNIPPGEFTVTPLPGRHPAPPRRAGPPDQPVTRIEADPSGHEASP